MEQTMFDETSNQAQQESQPEQESNDFLNNLVGEGKKFADVESLAKGKAESDRFIEELQNQITDLRNELSKRETAAEIADSLRSGLDSPAKDAKASDTNGLTADQVAEIVQSSITANDKYKSDKANAQEADAKFREVYGEKHREVLAAKANELGMSVSDLGKIAAKSPTAFYNMVGLNQTSVGNKDDGAPAKGDVNTQALDNLNPSKVVEGTKAYWDQKRKELGSDFWKPAIQQRLIADKVSGQYDK